jgi:hypothetical protein
LNKPGLCGNEILLLFYAAHLKLQRPASDEFAAGRCSKQTLFKQYITQRLFCPADTCASYHIALSTDNMTAAEIPRTQVKYHMLFPFLID